jgi:hypothetical protein
MHSIGERVEGGTRRRNKRQWQQLWLQDDYGRGHGRPTRRKERQWNARWEGL